MAILVLAGVLSVPSAVFAEANWYGSLRAGVKSSNSNIGVFDAGARWGIRGSSEAGEGLTAVYRFETKINSATADLSGGRLSYVGLSGGFGTVTVGQIWSASYNSFGAVTDNSWFWGNSETSYRIGNAVSYAVSNDLMSLQVDAVYGSPDSAAEEGDYSGMGSVYGLTIAALTGIDATQATSINHAKKEENLQQVEFGLSVNVGDMGKVAFAHVKDNHAFTNAGKLMTAGGDSVTAPSSWSSKGNFVAGELSVAGLTVYAGTGKTSYTNTTSGDGTADGTTATDGRNAVKADNKTTFLGARGSLGDTGLSYVFQWRDVKDSHKPWLLSLTKSLGDGVSLVVEHANNDGDSANTSGVALAINF